MRQKQAILERFPEPLAVVDFLTDGTDRQEEKGAILAALVRACQRDGGDDLAAALLCLGLWPGLDAIFQRAYRHSRAGANDLAADVMAEFLESVRRLDLGLATRVAATLVMNTERRLQRAREREAQERSAHAAVVPLPQQPRSSGIEDLIDLVPERRERQLKDLRQQLRPLLRGDTELAIRVLVLGENQRVVAQALGQSHAGIRKRIERVRKILHQKMSHFAFETRVCLGEGAVAPEESRDA